MASGSRPSRRRTARPSLERSPRGRGPNPGSVRRTGVPTGASPRPSLSELGLRLPVLPFAQQTGRPPNHRPPSFQKRGLQRIRSAIRGAFSAELVCVWDPQRLPGYDLLQTRTPNSDGIPRRAGGSSRLRVLSRRKRRDQRRAFRRSPTNVGSLRRPSNPRPPRSHVRDHSWELLFLNNAIKNTKRLLLRKLNSLKDQKKNFVLSIELEGRESFRERTLCIGPAVAFVEPIREELRGC